MHSFERRARALVETSSDSSDQGGAQVNTIRTSSDSNLRSRGIGVAEQERPAANLGRRSANRLHAQAIQEELEADLPYPEVFAPSKQKANKGRVKTGNKKTIRQQRGELPRRQALSQQNHEEARHSPAADERLTRVGRRQQPTEIVSASYSSGSSSEVPLAQRQGIATRSKSRRREFSQAAIPSVASVSRLQHNVSNSHTGGVFSSPSPHRQKGLLYQKSCQREKFELKQKIGELLQQVNEQKSRIYKMKRNLRSERLERSQSEQQVQQTRHSEFQYNKLLAEKDLTIKQLSTNEQRLQHELSEQQNITREAMQRLYDFQEEVIAERERQRVLRESELAAKVQEETERKSLKIVELEQIINDYQLKFRDGLRHEDNSKDRLVEENAKLKQEVLELRAAYRERSDLHELEIDNLQKNLESLRRTNEYLRQHHDSAVSEAQEKQQIFSRRVSNAKVSQISDLTALAQAERDFLNAQVDQLTKEVHQREAELADKDRLFAEQLDKINEKIEAWARDQRKWNEIDQQNILLKERLEVQQQKQLTQLTKHRESKKQWRKVYHELVNQIRALKSEVDDISNENRQLLAQLRIELASEQQQFI